MPIPTYRGLGLCQCCLPIIHTTYNLITTHMPSTHGWQASQNPSHIISHIAFTCPHSGQPSSTLHTSNNAHTPQLLMATPMQGCHNLTQHSIKSTQHMSWFVTCQAEPHNFSSMPSLSPQAINQCKPCTIMRAPPSITAHNPVLPMAAKPQLMVSMRCKVPQMLSLLTAPRSSTQYSNRNI